MNILLNVRGINVLQFNSSISTPALPTLSEIRKNPVYQEYITSTGDYINREEEIKTAIQPHKMKIIVSDGKKLKIFKTTLEDENRYIEWFFAFQSVKEKIERGIVREF